MLVPPLICEPPETAIDKLPVGGGATIIVGRGDKLAGIVIVNDVVHAYCFPSSAADKVNPVDIGITDDA